MSRADKYQKFREHPTYYSLFDKEPHTDNIPRKILFPGMF